LLKIGKRENRLHLPSIYQRPRFPTNQ
jgi:hypothetical protein